MSDEPQNEKPFDRDFFIAWAFSGLMIAGLLVYSFFPQLFTVEFWYTKSWEKNNVTITRDPSALIRNIGLIILPVGALYFAWWRVKIADQQAETANKQFDLAEQGQIIDRFQKSIEMLDKDEISVRIAGLLMLRDVSRDYPKSYAASILDIVSTFTIRRSSMEPGFKIAETNLEPETTERRELHGDIKHALKAISRIRKYVQRTSQKEKKIRPQLELVDLSGSGIRNLDLRYAVLRKANFNSAMLIEADFSGIVAFGANFSSADLQNVNFSNADLNNSDFTNATLQIVNFDGAVMYGVNFSGAIVDRLANLTDEQLKCIWAWEDDLPTNLSEGAPEPNIINLAPARLKEGYLKDQKFGYPNGWNMTDSIT